MADRIPFAKMHGAGNDFILIDNRAGYLKVEDTELFARLCRRRTGIGADGILLVDFAAKSKTFNLIYLNADGRQAAMCGNGARCAVYFMYLLNAGEREFDFSSGGVQYQGQVTGKERVKIFWPEHPGIFPADRLANILPPFAGRALLINSGVPHLVLESQIPLEEIDVAEWGKRLRFAGQLKPAGANIDFVQVKNGRLYIRTYERGVEGETLACGTGAVAAGVAAVEWAELEMPVEVIASGGGLRVGVGKGADFLWLEGPVKPVFSGSFSRTDFEAGP